MASLNDKRRKPIGIRFSEYLSNSIITFRGYQVLVLVLTFFAYTTYHLTRKAPGIVKSVLDPQSPSVGSSPWTRFHKFTGRSGQSSGWAPFNAPDGASMLGELDVAFLTTYALGSYAAGHLADRLDLRLFLTVGMMGTGLFTALYGAGFWLNIHNFYYYLVVQMLAGLIQSTGWPAVVAVVGNWFGKNKRGLIMGVWNAHTSVGSILGAMIASALLKYGWGWSLAIPGLIIALAGLTVFLFLPVSPFAVAVETEDGGDLEKDGIIESFLGEESETMTKAVGFFEAWKLPGVALFALCLFFSKLVAYTFFYWLPFYISHTEIDGKYLSDSYAGTLSTLFDFGGVLGGIVAGYISDRLGMQATTAAGFTYCTIVALFFYRFYGSISVIWNAALMFACGMFVNGPYALITTAVSADLGTQSSLKSNSRALATVAAIINGTGSVGAAIGPLLAGYISASSWDDVFAMLMVAAFLAGLFLTKLVVAEVKEKIDALRLIS